MALVHYMRCNSKLKKAYEAVFGRLYPRFDVTDRFPQAAKPVIKNFNHPENLAWIAMSVADRERVDRVFTNIGKAIAAFERTLISPQLPFDRFVQAMRLGRQSDALRQQEQRGLKIFVGKGKCVLCHSGPNFSDGEFHDLGIAYTSDGRVDKGRYRAIEMLINDPFNRNGTYADKQDPTAPVQFLRLDMHQLAHFKTPSLRELKYTTPYMHDGRFKTLREVIEFYSTRKDARPLETASSLVQPLNLTEAEVHDLQAFLESLSTPGDTIELRTSHRNGGIGVGITTHYVVLQP